MSEGNERDPGGDIIERLIALARKNGSSLDVELRAVLANRTRKFTISEMRAIADYICSMTPKGVKQTDSTKIIRWYRDHR